MTDFFIYMNIFYFVNYKMHSFPPLHSFPWLIEVLLYIFLIIWNCKGHIAGYSLSRDRESNCLIVDLNQFRNSRFGVQAVPVIFEVAVSWKFGVTASDLIRIRQDYLVRQVSILSEAKHWGIDIWWMLRFSFIK